MKRMLAAAPEEAPPAPEETAQKETPGPIDLPAALEDDAQAVELYKEYLSGQNGPSPGDGAGQGGFLRPHHLSAAGRVRGRCGPGKAVAGYDGGDILPTSLA